MAMADKAILIIIFAIILISAIISIIRVWIGE